VVGPYPFPPDHVIQESGVVAGDELAGNAERGHGRQHRRDLGPGGSREDFHARRIAHPKPAGVLVEIDVVRGPTD